MPNDKQAPKELKVTDKRIFTADGDIRDEFKKEIQPAEPQVHATAMAEAPPPPPKETASPKQPPQPAREPREERRQAPSAPRPAGEERRRSIADKAASPESPFTNFIEPLVAQAYMSLGMLRNPYQPQAKIDPAAARQMIEILALLQEKTRGNLTAEEDEFLSTHLGELKLAYVQRTKSI